MTQDNRLAWIGPAAGTVTATVVDMYVPHNIIPPQYAWTLVAVVWCVWLFTRAPVKTRLAGVNGKPYKLALGLAGLGAIAVCIITFVTTTPRVTTPVSVPERQATTTAQGGATIPSPPAPDSDSKTGSEAPGGPTVTPAPATHPRTPPASDADAHSARQSSRGDNSPNIAGNNNTVSINSTPMVPKIEGITVTFRQVPSPRTESPFAIEATVQVQADIQPFSIGLLADEPLDGGHANFLGGGVFTNFGEGHLNEDPVRSYYVRFDTPPVTPQTPLLVVVWGKQPFRIVKAVR